MPKTNPVPELDADDLTYVMCTLESARLLMDEIQEDFTEAFNPETEARYITITWPRARAQAWALAELLRSVTRDLADLGAKTGRPEQRGEGGSGEGGSGEGRKP